MGNPIIEIAVSQGDQTLGSIRLELYRIRHRAPCRIFFRWWTPAFTPG